jgi:hypothetical protein
MKPAIWFCGGMARRGHDFLAKRSFSVFIFAALLCTLLVKLFNTCG